MLLTWLRANVLASISRCIVLSGTAVAGTVLYLTVTAGGTIVVTVSGSLIRFQLESYAAGSAVRTPTSYIPTAGAIATRAVELPTMPAGAWYSRLASSIVVEATVPFARTTQANWLAQLDDGTQNNEFREWTQSGLTASADMDRQPRDSWIDKPMAAVSGCGATCHVGQIRRTLPSQEISNPGSTRSNSVE